MALHVLRLLLPITLALSLMLIDVADSDAPNLLQNGDFEMVIWSSPFGMYSSSDIIANGIKTMLPYWIAVHGGLQLLETESYMAPPNFNCSRILHMNFRGGPGHIISMPMYTPRKGAIYTILMSIADNPDGGPQPKALRVILFNTFGRRVGPVYNPFAAKNVSISRQAIQWQTVSCKMLGTGVPTILYLASLVQGPYGVLVANIKVTLDNLLENGSFEQLHPSVSVQFDGSTSSVQLYAPSSAINKWSLEAGTMAIFNTSLGALQPSTDDTWTLLDLSCQGAAATLSTTFNTSSSSRYTVLFDTAVNPTPAEEIEGDLYVKVEGVPSGKLLSSVTVRMKTTGYSTSSVGWQTKNLTFLNKTPDTSAKLTFVSKIPGSFGPLLDNVQVFQVSSGLNYAMFEIGTVPINNANKMSLLFVATPVLSAFNLWILWCIS